MEISVIIPTRGRPAQLAECLRALAEQDLAPDRFEVLVGVDGADEGEGNAFRTIAGGKMRGEVQAFDRSGPAATRNRLIERARGPLLLFLNDDVVPRPDLVRIHLEEQSALRDAGRSAMLLGAAPWAAREPDTLFDRLIRETSMVFFYDQMIGERARDPDQDWGYRHAWTLNLSLPAEPARAVGGFCDAMTRPVYEDLEFAWRLAQKFHMPVLYRSEAIVTHQHWYEPAAFLARDIVLGHQAWRLAEVAPQCAMDMFGTDVRSEAEIAYTREFLKRQEKAARRAAPMFTRLGEIPAHSVDGPYAADLINMIYEQTLLVRRYMWRWGHHAASQGVSVSDAARSMPPLSEINHVTPPARDEDRPAAMPMYSA